MVVNSFKAMCTLLNGVKSVHRKHLVFQHLAQTSSLRVHFTLTESVHRNNFIYLAFSKMCTLLLLKYIYIIREKKNNKKKNKYIYKKADFKVYICTPLVSLYKSIKDVYTLPFFRKCTHSLKVYTENFQLGA